jgi:putative ABC transport system permease protein
VTPRVLISRVADLLRGSARDRRLDEEMRLHREMLTEEFERRGLSPADAAAAARREFGGVVQVRMLHREQRGLAGIDALGQDVRFAFRVLSRDRAFSLTAILVLMLGIGVNNMLFTILNAHTLRGLPVPDVDRVLHASTRDKANVVGGLSWSEFEEMREGVSAVTLGAFTSGAASLGDPRRAPERVSRTFATSETFAILGVRPVLGRVPTAKDDEPGAPPVVLVSERLWETRYGWDPGILGRQVLIDGVLATVIGLLARESGFPTTAEVWQPLGSMRDLPRTSRTARILEVVGRVNRGTDVRTAAAELEAMGARLATAHPDSNAGVRLAVVPINERVRGRITEPAWLAFLTVSFLVVLISCANVGSLLMGRGLQRSREMAMRMSLGGTRSRIVRQLLTESLVLAVAGALLGLAFAVAGVRLFRASIPENVLPYWNDYVADARVVSALVAVSAVATLVFGLVPAWYTSRADPTDTLKQGGPTLTLSRGTTRWTTTFIVAQLAMSFVMLSNAALGLRTSAVTLPSDAALSSEQIMTASVTLRANSYPDAEARNAFYAGLRREIVDRTGVQAFAVVSTLPARITRQLRLRDAAGAAAEPIAARHVLVEPDYFKTLGLAPTRGREFEPRDGEEGQRTVLLNERLVELLFADTEPIGQRIGIVGASASAEPEEWLTVIGVAPVIRQHPSPEPEPVIYLPLRSNPPSTASLIVRTLLPPEKSVALLRDAALARDATVPLYNVATLRQAVEDAQWNGRVSRRLLLALTLIAASLAAAGLYAVMARMVGSRRREICIRTAVGASRGQIRRMLLMQAVRYLAMGTAAGIACVVVWELAFSPSARSLATVPGAHLADPVVLLAIAGALAATLVLASAGPVRKADSISPAATLRQD